MTSDPDFSPFPVRQATPARRSPSHSSPTPLKDPPSNGANGAAPRLPHGHQPCFEEEDHQEGSGLEKLSPFLRPKDGPPVGAPTTTTSSTSLLGGNHWTQLMMTSPSPERGKESLSVSQRSHRHHRGHRGEERAAAAAAAGGRGGGEGGGRATVGPAMKSGATSAGSGAVPHRLPSSSTTPIYLTEPSAEQGGKRHSISTNREFNAIHMDKDANNNNNNNNNNDNNNNSNNNNSRIVPPNTGAGFQPVYLDHINTRSSSHLFSGDITGPTSPVPRESVSPTSTTAFRPVPKVFTDFWEETNNSGTVLSPLVHTRSSHTPHAVALNSFSQPAEHRSTRNPRRSEVPEVQEEWEELIVGSKEPVSSRPVLLSGAHGHNERENSLTPSSSVKLPALDCSIGGGHSHLHNSLKDHQLASHGHAPPQGHGVHLMGSTCSLLSRTVTSNAVSRQTSMLVENGSAFSGGDNNNNHGSISVSASVAGNHWGVGRSNSITGAAGGGGGGGLGAVTGGGDALDTCGFPRCHSSFTNTSSSKHQHGLGGGEECGVHLDSEPYARTNSGISSHSPALPRCTPPAPSSRHGNPVHPRLCSFGLGGTHPTPPPSRDRLSPIHHHSHSAQAIPHALHNSSSISISVHEPSHALAASARLEPPSAPHITSTNTRHVTSSAREIMKQSSGELAVREEKTDGSTNKRNKCRDVTEDHRKKGMVEDAQPSSLNHSPPSTGKTASPRSKYDSLRLAFRSTAVQEHTPEPGNRQRQGPMSGSLLSDPEEEENETSISHRMLDWLKEQKALVEAGVLTHTETPETSRVDTTLTLTTQTSAEDQEGKTLHPHESDGTPHFLDVSGSPEPLTHSDTSGLVRSSSHAPLSGFTEEIQRADPSPLSTKSLSASSSPQKKHKRTNSAGVEVQPRATDVKTQSKNDEAPHKRPRKGSGGTIAGGPTSPSAEQSASLFLRRTSMHTPPLPNFDQQQSRAGSPSPSVQDSSLSKPNAKQMSTGKLTLSKERSEGATLTVPPRSRSGSTGKQGVPLPRTASVSSLSRKLSGPQHRTSVTIDAEPLEMSDSNSRNKSLHLHPVCQRNTVPYKGQRCGAGDASSPLESDSSVSLRDDGQSSQKNTRGRNTSKPSTPASHGDFRVEREVSGGKYGVTRTSSFHSSCNREASPLSQHHGPSSSFVSPSFHPLVPMFSDGTETLPLPKANKTLPFYPCNSQQAFDYLNNF